MNRKLAIEKLRECKKDKDIEGAHSDADEILCELLRDLGYVDVVIEWEQVPRWYA